MLEIGKEYVFMGQFVTVIDFICEEDGSDAVVVVEDRFCHKATVSASDLYEKPPRHDRLHD